MEFTQLAINGLFSASVFALVAVGLGIVYRVAGFLDFSHAVLFVVAPYAAYCLITRFGAPLWSAALVGVLSSTAIGGLMGVALYAPLRRRHGTWLTLCLASLGMYVVLQNVISLACGDDVKSIRTWQAAEGIDVLGARVTGVQLTIMAVGVATTCGTAVCLRATRAGRAVRAVAGDEELSAVSGVPVGRVVLVSFVLGSSLAGIAGILYSLDVDISPGMGLPVLMMAIAALVVGGVQSILGIAIGAILLGMARQFGAWVLGAQWQDAVAFIILLVFLLVRSQGLLGRRTRKARA